MSAGRTADDGAGTLVRELAHARAGDKGDISNIGVFAYNEACYEILEESLTEDLVARELEGLVEGTVTRYDLPNIDGFNFVLEEALDGGLSRSLRADKLGKSMSYSILGIELDVSAPDIEYTE